MQFACHTWGFNDKSLTEALGTIARMGFRYVDLGTGAHLEMAKIAKDPRGSAAAIRADLDLFNLKLSDVYVMLPRISLADDERRRREITLFKAILPFLVALGAPGVTLSPGLLHGADDETAFDRSVAALQEMVTAAKAATPATQLQVSIEPHMDSMAQTPDAALKILDRVPDLALTLDWAQLVCQDVFHDEIVKLIPRARHVQVRQAARAQLQLPFERGRIQPAKVVSALQEADYDGVVCIEYMQTKSDRHGMVAVDALTEAVKLRDALRDARKT
jgi:sugar phosphate isomerase/epimerase